MASNYSNYFFSMKTEAPAYDEYFYRLNTATGSSVFTGSSDTWRPVLTGTISAAGPRVFDNYIFSPTSFGNLRDTFYCPPQRYLWFGDFATPDSPLVLTTESTSSVYLLSTNQDLHSRISTRYVDGVNDDPTSFDYTML